MTPRQVALGALDVLEAGLDEVFPGELLQATANAFRDPEGVQAQLAQLVHAID